MRTLKHFSWTQEVMDMHTVDAGRYILSLGLANRIAFQVQHNCLPCSSRAPAAHGPIRRHSVEYWLKYNLIDFAFVVHVNIIRCQQ